MVRNFDGGKRNRFLCFGNKASRDRYVGQLVCQFRQNFQKSLGDIVQGLFCTDYVRWSGPGTVMGRTQSVINKNIGMSVDIAVICYQAMIGNCIQHGYYGQWIRSRNFSTKIFPAEAYSCLQVCVLSLWHSIRAQGTLLDLQGPPNGPQNGPCEANFRGPLVKQGPPGSLDGPNWSIFFHRPLDNGLTWIYSLVWG